MTLCEIQRGDAGKSDPFTILIVASPAYEYNGTISADPVMQRPAAFDAAVAHIHASLFGQLPGQRELALGSPGIGSAVRVLAHFEQPAAVDVSCALVSAEKGVDHFLVPRREVIAAFASRLGCVADVVFAISRNPRAYRACSLPASDDLARPGVRYTMDGTAGIHACHSTIPGTVAIDAGSRSLVALHEFHHAMGSVENGQIVDLYRGATTEGVNLKRTAQPQPGVFCIYEGRHYPSEPPAGGSGTSAFFRCARHDDTQPALMGNFEEGEPDEACQNDLITRDFVLDRVKAKVNR